MKINATLFLGLGKKKVNMHVGEVQIEESDKDKLLDITLDKKLSFKAHPNTL